MSQSMFESVLIANRGEIACRIAKTAKRLGMRTVAVYSTADEGALHMRLADEAYLIGEAEPRQSYLDIERLIATANKARAQCVHPGYGFLSENADFAEACAKAGIVFVGPPPDAIRAMGLKDLAKTLMEKARVPAAAAAACAASTSMPISMPRSKAPRVKRSRPSARAAC